MKKIFILILIFFSAFLLFSMENKKIIISKDLELIKLNDAVYIHVSYTDYPKYGRISANGLLIIDEKDALIVDTPWNNELTIQLFEWVKNNFKMDIKYVIIAHSHDDNMGGLEAAHKNGAISYSLDATKEILKKQNRILPNKTFKNDLVLKLKNISLIIEYLGAGHTVDNIVVWLPEFKILFGGCLIKALSSNNLGNLEEANVKEWPNTLEKIMNKYKQAVIVIPGHGEYGGIELLKHTHELALKEANKQ
jgi:metallo-beta-lactamase class B